MEKTKGNRSAAVSADVLSDALADESFWWEVRDLYRLTPRQIDLAHGMCLGESTKETARRWTRSHKSVEVFRLQLYDKLAVHSAIQIVRLICGLAADFAMRTGGLSSCQSCPLRQTAAQGIGGPTT